MESRQRVLRGRSVLNAIKGTWRNLFTGREILAAYPADRVQEATKAFLRTAEGLLGAWNAYRAGKAPAAFLRPETAYLDASATLTEMHMVMEPPRKLDGEALLTERERLISLAAFPDQALIAPVMGPVKNRAAQIEAYAATPNGASKITEAESRRVWARYDREQAARAERERQIRDASARQAEADRRDRQREQDAQAEDRRISQKATLCIRMAGDPEARAIFDKWGLNADHLPAPDGRLWRQERRVKGAGHLSDYSLVVDLVADDITALLKAREAQAVAPPPRPDPAPEAEQPKPATAPPKGPTFGM